MRIESSDKLAKAVPRARADPGLAAIRKFDLDAIAVKEALGIPGGTNASS